MTVIIATGTGGCGTKTFANLMSSVVGMSLHYGIVQGRAIEEQIVPHLIQRGDPRIACPSEAALEWNQQAIQRRYEVWQRDRMFIESAPYLAFNLKLISRLPWSKDVKIIHLVRDPQEVISSLVRRFSTTYAEPDESTDVSTWSGWADSLPTFLGAEGQLERLALYWEYTNRAVAKTRLQRMIMNTRDLSSPTKWAEMYEWLGINLPIPPKLDSKWNESATRQLSAKRMRLVQKAVGQFCRWKVS